MAGTPRLRLPTAARLPAFALRRAWPWYDSSLTLCFFLLTVQLRRPYKMLLPYGWDSLLYLRALDHFNATIHQPQPPGYLFYVSLGRLFRLVVHDPHRALVWVSILTSAVAVAGLYLLARLLYDRLTGVLAAGMLLSSVTFWFYSEIAYPYTTLAAGSIVLALLALALRWGYFSGALGVALVICAYGLIGGFRQDLLLFLAPLFTVAMWGRPVRHWLVAVAAGAFGVLVWLIPTAALSEGLVKYLSATFQQSSNASGGSSVLTSGSAMLWTNGREVAIFIWRGLYYALLPLGYCLLRQCAAPRQALQDRRFLWVLLWLTPPLAFYLLAHVGDYGYTLSILPALSVLAARGIVVAARDLVRLGAWLAARWAAWRSAGTRWGFAVPAQQFTTVALALLLGASVMGSDARIFLNRQGQFSVGGIGCFDRAMRARVKIVREYFPFNETLIFSAGYYQHVRYFLPGFRAWLYKPNDGPQAERAIASGIRYVLVFDEVIRPASSQAGFKRAVLPCGGSLYYAAVRQGDVIRFDARTATIAVRR